MNKKDTEETPVGAQLVYAVNVGSLACFIGSFQCMSTDEASYVDHEIPMETKITGFPHGFRVKDVIWIPQPDLSSGVSFQL